VRVQGREKYLASERNLARSRLYRGACRLAASVLRMPYSRHRGGVPMGVDAGPMLSDAVPMQCPSIIAVFCVMYPCVYSRCSTGYHVHVGSHVWGRMPVQLLTGTLCAPERCGA
jgi:hypothetical protein